MVDDCIFCKIAAKQIPTEFVYEDEYVVAFPDINPEAPTHMLIIPKKHIPSIACIQPEDREIMAHLMEAAKEVAKDAHLDAGFRLVTNCGKQAGQTVNHLHFHLIGGRNMNWPPG